LDQLTTDGLDGLLLPKVNSAEDVLAVSRFIDEHGSPDHKQNLRMIASIESPLGLLNMRQIVTASDKVGGLLVGSPFRFFCMRERNAGSSAPQANKILTMRPDPPSERQFAAEDYCASSRIIRTPSRYEMLYARSSVVAVAHAYNLAAIDLVCVKYKGEEAEAILREESEEGRRLGFTGELLSLETTLLRARVGGRGRKTYPS
jgi:citrate lyase subunit beta-like protein